MRSAESCAQLIVAVDLVISLGAGLGPSVMSFEFGSAESVIWE